MQGDMHQAAVATAAPQGLLDHLALVAAMTRAFASTGDFEGMVRGGLQRVTRHLMAEAGSLFLLDGGGPAPEIVCHACCGPVDITGLRLPWGTGIVGRCIAEDAPQMVRDVRADPDFGMHVDDATGFVTRSILVAPLSVGDEKLGAIEIINKRVPDTHTGDHLFTAEDEGLLTALSAATALALAHMRLTERLMEQERLRREMEMAAEIQRGLLPVSRDDGFPAHGLVMPIGRVSGDFYDVVELPDGRLWLACADVSGKGLDAALLMAKTASLFRCLCKEAVAPGALLGRIDAELCETSTRGMFVTMACGLYDPRTGGLIVANAGHEPPLVHATDVSGFISVPAGGPPLGVLAGLIGPDGYPEVRLSLGPGHSLTLFTDGLTEIADSDGTMLGHEGVRRLITEAATLPPSARPAAIARAALPPGREPRDDLTVVVLEHRP